MDGKIYLESIYKKFIPLHSELKEVYSLSSIPPSEHNGVI